MDSIIAPTVRGLMTEECEYQFRRVLTVAEEAFIERGFHLDDAVLILAHTLGAYKGSLPPEHQSLAKSHIMGAYIAWRVSGDLEPEAIVERFNELSALHA